MTTIVASVVAAGLAGCGSGGDASASPPATTVTATDSTSSPATATTLDGGIPPEVEPDDPPEDDAPRRVLVLGDSLAAGAVRAADLEGQLHEAGFDLVEVLAAEGEGLHWGIEQIEARAAVPEVVIVELGTNPSGDATGFGAEVRRLLRALRLRGAEQIAWLTPAHRDQDRYADKVAILRRIDDIDLLADWAAAAEANPDELVADGLHPSSEGYAELVELLVDTAVDLDDER